MNSIKMIFTFTEMPSEARLAAAPEMRMSVMDTVATIKTWSMTTRAVMMQMMMMLPNR